ncbi:MAG: hypothetical protein QXW35_02860 [Candidatus Aenigmatarchaeota archaeon]
MAGVEEIKGYIVVILGVALGITALLQVISPIIADQNSPMLLQTLGPLMVAFVAILLLFKLI